MSIERLSSTSALIAALRAEITRKSDRSARKGSAPAASKARQGDEAKRRDVNALRRELVEIVKGISSNDHDAMNAARPRVIRAVLLWEFGSELREYSEWQPMLDTLVQTLEGNERHRDEFARLVRELQG